MRSFVLLCRSIASGWSKKMNSKLPIDVDSQLRELGVLPSDHFDDDLEELRPSISNKRSYIMPDLDENGEPDF